MSLVTKGKSFNPFAYLKYSIESASVLFLEEGRGHWIVKYAEPVLLFVGLKTLEIN